MRSGIIGLVETESQDWKLSGPFRPGWLATVLTLLLSGCGEEINSAARGYERHLAGDFTAARIIWSAGAAQDDDLSLYYLGRIHDIGEGVAQDYEKAVEYYRRSAQLGSPYAQGSLAVLYAYGKGVPRDFVKSYAYSTLAAEGYSRWASDQREAALRNRDLVSTRMSRAEIVAAQRLATRLVGRPLEGTAD